MDSRMLITYIMVDIFCFIIVFVIRKNLTTDIGSELEVRMLRGSMDSYICFMAAGLVGLTVEHGGLFYSKAIDYAANMISLSMLSMASFFWFMYVQLRTNKKFAAGRWRVIAYIPIMIVLLLCISSPVTGWAFYIDSSNSYQRGPMFMLVSALPLLYDLAASITAYISAFREKQISKRRQYRNLASFVYFPLIASILQIWLAGMPILAVAAAASYYIVFSSMQRAMIYNDSLSGMNNRRRAMLYMEEKMTGVSADNVLTVYMVDGNKFKYINDTYGHIEGDSAIMCMSEAIQAVCGKYDIFGARYGGDEFILIKCGGDSRDAAEIGEAINQRLWKICDDMHKIYRLSVSVGGYRVTSAEEGIENIIAKADKELYKNKAKR